MDTLSVFRSACLDPAGYGRRLRDSGRSLLGYMCTYAPEEIISAAGLIPFRLTGCEKPCASADRHLQSYACSLARECLEQGLDGSLSFLEGVVFPHTCDTVQRISDIWRLNCGFQLHYDLVLPVTLATESSARYYTDVLRTFIQDMERDLKRPVTDESLRDSVRLYNRIRSSLVTLEDMQRENPSLMKGEDYRMAITASMIMERNEYLGHLRQILSDLAAVNPGPSTDCPSVFLAGGACAVSGIYSMVEEAGGRVCGDDLCAGSRSFRGQIDTDGDIVENIASRYRERIACPAKHTSVPRYESVTALARRSGAGGVIIPVLKFCDPHLFDYPTLRDTLEAQGLPVLLLELDGTPGEAIRTRIQAFIERL